MNVSFVVYLPPAIFSETAQATSRNATCKIYFMVTEERLWEVDTSQNKEQGSENDHAELVR